MEVFCSSGANQKGFDGGLSKRVLCLFKVLKFYLLLKSFNDT